MVIEYFDIDVVGHFGPIGHRECHILVVVENRAAKRHEVLVVPADGKEPMSTIGAERKRLEIVTAPCANTRAGGAASWRQAVAISRITRRVVSDELRG